MSQSKIIIIGAGASGIAAACRLIEKGFQNVTILEAKNRIGGRIHTVNFADNVIDLGAQWVHGENVVFNLANPHNLLDSNFDGDYEKNLFADGRGNLISSEECANALAIYVKLSEWDENDLKEWNGSYGEFFQEKFYKEFQENRFTNTKRAQQFYEWMEKYDNHMQCSDSLFEVSAKRLREYETCDGNLLMNWKNRGFKTVLDLLMKSYPSAENKLPVMNEIIFNKEVSNINYTSDNKVVVSTKDGKKFEASHVIFTPSLGVLKNEYKTMFNPSLPEIKEKAIEGFNFGAVNKFFLEFSHRWWPEGTSGLSFLWSDEDKREFLSTWGQEMSWLCDIFIFFVVENQKSVLCGWAFGETARLTEKLTNDEISNGLHILLKTFYGKTYDIPKAVNFIRSKWFTDKDIRGGYSFRSMKTERMGVKSQDLSDPITTDSYKPIILFAGEATHERFFSTVHGAIESGFREADRLIEYYGIHDDLKLRRKLFETETTELIIIGAGISGLAAAMTLEKEGFHNYILFEAMDRVGGRIYTTHWNDDEIENGAQFLHGDKSKLGQYCHELNLLSDDHSSEAEGLYIRDDGLEIDSHLVIKVDDFVRYTLEECEKFANDNKILQPEIHQNIGKVLRTRFNKYLEATNDTEKNKNIMKDLFDWNIKFLNIDNSCLSIDELSVKGWGNFQFVGGQEHSIFKSSYSSITKIIADNLNKNSLRLNSPVEKVEWCEELRNEENFKSILVTLNDNKKIYANCVIITCSLGFLKENYQRMFHPPLPNYLSRGIECLGFGLINKIFLEFNEIWWKRGTRGFQFIWRRDNEEFPSSGKLPTWTKDLTGFDILKDEKNGIFLGWIGGRGAHIIETLSEQQIAEDCLQLLKFFLKNNNIPFPRRCLRTRWYDNKFVRGAYSHITTKCDNNGVSCGILSEPVWGFVSNNHGTKRVPIMMLAGEGTHEHFYSTTHGAFDTGVKQAKKFLKHHRSEHG
ncbi:spermine oxidase-like [Leptopilina heterotoma]|uniref:spermine oxidase-like n=1 Tax=Leptopilina heterotoma TaxID=63436 RepID=UPI001CA84F7E|nr:spermine oxidase-like [Leptopilina heterotoma]XP_043460909.1 spermine oxidase-like [Leptopilina heterotoma]XP_043460910.1 spermine oxidase-like [Leptopilina heterotoma]